MRMSDWSSDVCSSDLIVPERGIEQSPVHGIVHEAKRGAVRSPDVAPALARVPDDVEQVVAVHRGRSEERRRERVCQYVLISVVAGSLKKKNESIDSKELWHIREHSRTASHERE